MGFATDSMNEGPERGDSDADEDATAVARRAALLKRYGDRTTSEPVAVAAATAAEDAAQDELDHNEIWGDCELILGLFIGAAHQYNIYGEIWQTIYRDIFPIYRRRT